MVKLQAIIPMIGMRALIGVAAAGQGRYYVFPEDVFPEHMSNFIIFGSRWEYFGLRECGDSSFDLPVRTKGEHLMQALEDGYYVNVLCEGNTDLVGDPAPVAVKHILTMNQVATVPHGHSLIVIKGAVYCDGVASTPPVILNAKTKPIEVKAIADSIVFDMSAPRRK